MKGGMLQIALAMAHMYSASMQSSSDGKLNIAPVGEAYKAPIESKRKMRKLLNKKGKKKKRQAVGP